MATARAQPAAWLSDSSISQCQRCGNDFGFFHRRHHCRACGGIFCAACSAKSAAGVPGFAPNEVVRCCDPCYYGRLAFLLVYHWNGSYTTSTFGELRTAKAAYASVPSGASRALLKLGTGELVSSWFCRDSWKVRIMTKVSCERRLRLSPANMAEEAPPSSLNAPAVEATSASATEGAAMATPTLESAVLVAWKSTAECTFSATWFHSQADAAATEAGAKRLLADIAPVVGAVMSIRGECLHIVNTTWFTSNASVTGECEKLRAQTSVTLGWHAGGEYQLRCFGCNIADALAHMTRMSAQSPAVLLDHRGAIVAHTCPQPSWREGIAKFVGTELFANLKIPALLVCTAGEQPVISTNLFAAHKAMMRGNSAAILCPNGPDQVPSVMQLNPMLRNTGDIAKFVDAARALLPTLPSDGSTAAPSPQSPAVQPSSSSTTEALSSLDCPICFSAYDEGPSKPCLCVSCGNTMCKDCMKRMQQCAFCRVKLASIVTNVQLLQLVSRAS